MGFFDKFKNVLESGENFRYLDSLIKNGSNVIVLDSNISLSDNERSDFF